MKRTYLFTVISSVALVIVLIIQVNWIFQTAKIKEEIFNEKANIVLSRTTEALSIDKETCRKIEDLAGKGNSFESTVNLEENQINTIDSLFKHYLKLYNFHIDYKFEVVKPNPVNALYDKSIANFYNKPIEAVGGNNDIELKLIFPEKKKFIIAEIGIIFITSVILILVVIAIFWKTIRSLIREQKISEQTTDFLNNMTHELKTPLTNIALAGKMLIKDSIDNKKDKFKDYLRIIIEENEKLQSQVDQVLSMSALEKRELLNKIKFDFHELIKQSINSISMQMEYRGGRFKLELDAERSFITGYQTHLTNTINNLVDNAIKYSYDKPEITIRTTNNDDNLVVTFSDNGIGIEKKYQKKVFDKFFRVPTGNVHEAKGFGVGLSYIKRIIELHEGTINVESGKMSDGREKGTTFIITLPNATREA